MAATRGEDERSSRVGVIQCKEYEAARTPLAAELSEAGWAGWDTLRGWKNGRAL